ncbi:MAG: prepilin-type N-terminal cleavage/methylation domain-containing protein [Sedimentisphaerales bacterium]|nr:prepilin-type N-terminal cleavage/methylation domain-containing protein [Sedimentisphaerales bacterium]
MDRCGRNHGFTLIEALVGSLILAIGAVVICGLSHRCLINTKRGLEYERACRLLDECLDTMVVLHQEELFRAQKIEGDFGPNCPHFGYILQSEPADQNHVYRVTAIVQWQVGDKPHQVQATTLLYETPRRDNPKT